MKSILIILAFVLLLASKIYSYLYGSISFYDGFAFVNGITNYVTVGFTIAAFLICLWQVLHTKEKNVVLRYCKGTLLIIGVVLFLWFVYSILTIGFFDTIYSPMSPIGYLPIFLIPLGANEKCWTTIKRIAPCFATIYLFLTFSNYYLYIKLMGLRVPGNSPFTVYLVTSYWWIAITTLNLRRSKFIYKILVFSMIISIGLLAFTVTYRSWMIQSVLLMIVAILQMGRTKSANSLMIIVAILGILYVGNDIANSTDWNGEVTALQNKNKRDTRKFQYEEIFSQIPTETLIFGGGQDASYTSLVSGKDYKYVDNQYIYMAFHYGLFLLIPWLLIWVKGIRLMYLDSKFQFRDKTLMFICILWLFALGGLSVYNAIEINPQNCLLSIALGRGFYLSAIKRINIT